MPTVLLVEDDTALASMVIDWLGHEHYRIEHVSNGAEGRDRLKFYEYDVAILDWDLPEVSGIDICRGYRSAGGKIPVLMLTGKSTIDQKSAGLDAGADDYLTKPFHMKELSARLRALLRRPAALVSNVLSAGDIQLDPTTYRVTKGGADIELLPKEFALLEYLMRHPNQVFSMDALLSKVWGNEADAGEEAIRSCIKRLRKKIDNAEGESLIRNVHGVGYKLQVFRR